jgi:hypothetical protein
MSLWDKLDRFSAADAAALAVPNDASEGRALLIRMQKGYEKALSETVFKHQDTAHPGVRGHGSALRYGSFDVPLPEEHLYSWALELHAKLLFRPDFHVVSCQAFHNWVREEAGSHGAFSCNFGAQEFSRDELYRWLTFHGIESAYAFKRLAPTTPVVPVAPKPLDITVLATPEDLLKAFGQWGLKKDWFNSPRLEWYPADGLRLDFLEEQIQPVNCLAGIQDSLMVSLRGVAGRAAKSALEYATLAV